MLSKLLRNISIYFFSLSINIICCIATEKSTSSRFTFLKKCSTNATVLSTKQTEHTDDSTNRMASEIAYLCLDLCVYVSTSLKIAHCNRLFCHKIGHYGNGILFCSCNIHSSQVYFHLLYNIVEHIRKQLLARKRQEWGCTNESLPGKLHSRFQVLLDSRSTY